MKKIPSHIRRKAEKLRHMMTSIPHEAGSTSFEPIFDLFIEMAADKAFQALGEADDASVVMPALEMLCRAVMRRQTATLALMAAVFVPELSMRHGGVLFDGQPGGYFMFDGDERGMFGFLGHDGNNRMMRFTLTHVQAGEEAVPLWPTIAGTQ